MKNTNVDNRSNNRPNYIKFTLRIAVVVAVGTITFGAACGVSKSGINAAASPNTTSDRTKTVKNVPEKTPIAGMPKTDVAPPRALVDAGEFAENIYDFAKAKDWTKAMEKSTRLEKAVADLKAQDLSTPQVVETSNKLSTAVQAKNEMDAMSESNQMTFLLAEQSAKFNLKVPVEIIKLDYYGREIERLAMIKDEAKLRSTTAEMRQTWDAVKPKIEAKGATKVASKFESLVAQTEKAASLADYAKVATPILDEVDNLEKVFEK